MRHDAGPPEKGSSANIVLIGFMGVGKGRVARALAELTGLYAVDTDKLIESLTKSKIRRIFAEQGEPHFRALERTTALWLEQNVRNTIISSGGGFYAVPNIARIGRIVYLHSSLNGILNAIQRHPKAEAKIRKRPLLADMDGARKLYEERLPLYRAVCGVEVDMERLSIRKTAMEIASRLHLPQKRPRTV